MPTVTNFEDLEIWKESRILANRVYETSSLEPFRKDLGLRDQIHRAVVSVSSNIAEGFERNSRTEFAHFLRIAKGSLGEVRSQLHIALDLGYISTGKFSELRTECMDLSSKIGRLITYLSTQKQNHSR